MMGKPRRTNKIKPFDLHAMKEEEGGSLMEIDTQRSMPLE
jgi:hypothetical protein